MLQNLLTHAKHLPGWTTKRKMLVIESDDWGSTRMPNPEVYAKLASKGILGSNNFLKYDTLASKGDLENLFDVLGSVQDTHGNHAVFCPFVNVTNADFKKIIDSNYEQYYFQTFVETLKDYFSEDVFHSWQKGIKNNLFIPEYHGREHFNVPLLMKVLKSKNQDLIKAFSLGVIHIPLADLGTRPIKSLAPTYYYENEPDKKYLFNSFIEGSKIFEEIFEYAPTSFNPPNGIFNTALEGAITETKLKTIVVNRKRQEPDGNGNLIVKNYLFKYGKKNNHGHTYYRRNCKFEPVQKEYSRARTIHEILTAIKMKKPAVLSTHRINFVGSLDVKIRDRSLRELRAILKEVVKTLPDIEFVSSKEFASILLEGNKNQN